MSSHHLVSHLLEILAFIHCMALNSPLGSLSEKIAVLKFVGDKPNSNISFRDALLASGTGDLYENVLKPFLKGYFLDRFRECR